MPLAGTPHGRALAGQQVEVVAENGGSRLFAPVTSRGEAVGVLELGLDEPPDEQTLASVAEVAHVLAYVVIANRRFTDLYEWGQRSLPLSLEAEIQHRLLPGSYTCEAGQFTLAGWLEPAGDVGGDTFDFSVERDTLHLSMTDAMGHTLGAALLATVLVGALRNARRRMVDLAEQARLADDALTRFASDGGFVTGQLVRVDLNSGVARIVNAGHPPPVRIRDGRAETLALQADPPFAAPKVRAVPRAGAAAGTRRPAGVPDRRHARAQRDDRGRPLGPDGEPAAASPRGGAGAHASRGGGLRREVARRRHRPLLRLARRSPAGPRTPAPAPTCKPGLAIFRNR